MNKPSLTVASSLLNYVNNLGGIRSLTHSRASLMLGYSEIDLLVARKWLEEKKYLVRNNRLLVPSGKKIEKVRQQPIGGDRKKKMTTLKDYIAATTFTDLRALEVAILLNELYGVSYSYDRTIRVLNTMAGVTRKQPIAYRDPYLYSHKSDQVQLSSL